MTEHAKNCDKGPDIDAVKRQQTEHGLKIDLILQNQERTSSELRDALNRLTSIIETDIGTRLEVEQGKKERELLFQAVRRSAEDINVIKERNAKCDGAGIFENFPKMYDWYQANIAKSDQFVKVYAWYLGELGWRRFVPAVMTVMTGMMALYIGIQSLGGFDSVKPVVDHTHKSSYGIPSDSVGE
jgi:hypothetical protein